MTCRTVAPLILLLLAHGTLACSGSGGSASLPLPAAPSAVSPPAPPAPAAPCIAPETFYGCSYTRVGASLSGMVYEVTPAGPVGIPGAYVYCEACGLITHTWATADASGVYRFSGDLATGGGIWLSPGFLTAIAVQHKGYQDPPGLPPLRGPLFHIPSGPGWREVSIEGDTRFDIELVRQ